MPQNIIICDTRQHAGKHEAKEAWWRGHGVELRRAALTERGHAADPGIAPCGDYCAPGSNVCVDTKRDVDELCGNLCGDGKEHARVRREMVRACEAGYRLVFLVENGLGYEHPADVLRWVPEVCRKCRHRARTGKPGGCVPSEPGGCATRKTKRKPAMGARLYKTMCTMEARYGARFMFCAPEDAARVVCELLGVQYDDE